MKEDTPDDLPQKPPANGRRSFFRASAALGAASLVPGTGRAQSASAPAATASAPAAAAQNFFHDEGRLWKTAQVVRGARYWEHNTFMTPVEDLYIRNHYETPTAATHPLLDKANWRLKIHGNAIEKPLEISYADLLQMPSRSIITTLECNGNARTLFWEQQNMMEAKGSNWCFGAVGQVEWQYVPMSHIFAIAGLRKDAKSVLFWSGVDGKDMGRPMSMRDIAERPDEIGLAFKMNGNELTPDHGAPVRNIVPGWGGCAWIKWLTEVRIDAQTHWCRLNTYDETFIGPDYQDQIPKPAADDIFIGVTASDIKGPMVKWSAMRSMLKLPLVLERAEKIAPDYPLKRGEWPSLPAGSRLMEGYAWAPQHGVRAVEYRIDGGPWKRARILAPNLGRYTWVRFEFAWTATPGEHLLETRAVDNKGNRQPDKVPFNALGFSFGGVPKFKVRVV